MSDIKQVNDFFICKFAIIANIKQFALSNEIKITNGHSKTGNLLLCDTSELKPDSSMFIPDLSSELDCTCFVIGV